MWGQGGPLFQNRTDMKYTKSWVHPCKQLQFVLVHTTYLGPGNSSRSVSQLRGKISWKVVVMVTWKFVSSWKRGARERERGLYVVHTRSNYDVIYICIATN